VSTEVWSASWPEDAPALTPLQREILLLVVHGYTNARIAEQLGMTPGGVAVQVARIVERLGLGTRGEIALWALAHGIVP
jgi:DNA-binding CsgD family transcriptional regulator